MHHPPCNPLGVGCWALVPCLFVLGPSLVTTPKIWQRRERYARFVCCSLELMQRVIREEVKRKVRDECELTHWPTTIDRNSWKAGKEKRKQRTLPGGFFFSSFCPLGRNALSYSFPFRSWNCVHSTTAYLQRKNKREPPSESSHKGMWQTVSLKD